MAAGDRFAVLIDADNVSEKYVKIILDEVSSSGTATIKRIYGDWTQPNMNTWKSVLLNYSIMPVQQYGYTSGKNSTDSAMIIDAMDILYDNNVEGFCIVSSDSDFTRLATRLRESGMQVIGMGEKKTPTPFVAACDKFKYLDVLLQGISGEPFEKPQLVEENAEQSMTNLQTISNAIYAFVDDAVDEGEWLNIAEVGSNIQKRFPDFDVRNYGFKKFTPFLSSLGFLEFETVPSNDGNRNTKSVYVRIKAGK